MPEQLFIVDVTIPERAIGVKPDVFERVLDAELANAKQTATAEYLRRRAEVEASRPQFYPGPGKPW